MSSVGRLAHVDFDYARSAPSLRPRQTSVFALSSRPRSLDHPGDRPSMTHPHKLFGTDGVRGVAGTELTAELALALGRAAALQASVRAAPGADRARHARVGADARGGAGVRAWPRAGATRGWPGSCRPPARRSWSGATGSTSPRSSRPPTTPGSTTGSSSSARTGESSTTSSRSGSRRWRAMPAPRSRRSGGCAQLDGALDDYLRALLSAFQLDLAGRAGAARLRQRRDLSRRRPSAFERLGATVGAIGDRAGRAEHQRGLRLDVHPSAWRSWSRTATPRSDSPSTATATA